MIKTLYTLTIIFIGFYSQLYSQDSLSSRAFKVLNDGLKSYEMNLTDIWLPIDTAENNYHRLMLFDTLFGNPLRSVDMVKYHANELMNLNEKTFDAYFSKVFDQLEFRKYQPVYYENNLSTKEIDNELGFGTDTTLGNEGGQLFRMFISPVIQIKQLLADDYLYKKGVRLTFLKENYEKVLLGSMSEDSGLGLDSLQKIAKDFFIYSQSANRSLIYSNGISLYQTLLKLSQIAKNNIDILKNNIKTTIIETPYGRIALGGAGNDKYEGEFTAILDIGGDDSYNISHSQNGKDNISEFIVDLSGNDTYAGKEYSLGGSAFGINVLIDLEGNDTYNSQNFSLGCGVFGVGILHDLSGNDKYIGKIMSEGASSFGIGMLLDNAGNDKYDISGFGQGLALTKGFGLLLDNFGQDVYYSDSNINVEGKTFFSFSQGVSAGYYPYASGGIGLLIDGRGNDNYRAGISGQGFGYWFGMGAIYDFNGYDDYESYQYAQGVSVNSGIGILFDNQGNDSYSSESIAQGFANENSFALLLDDFGNDSYNINSPTEKQIEYSQPSYSILLDASASSTFGNYIEVDKGLSDKKKDGNNPEPKNKDLSYYIKIGFPVESLQHDIREKYGSFNLFMGDTSIKNYYSNSIITPQGNYKADLYDLSQFDFERKLIFTHSTIDSSAILVLIQNKTVEEIYTKLLSYDTLTFEEINFLKDKIIDNPPSFEFLAGRLRSESMFERRILVEILSDLMKKGSLSVKNLLVDSCVSKEYQTIRICMDLMSEYKIYDIVKRISELYKSKSWMLRAEAAKAIGKIGANPQIDILRALMEDNHPYVRAEAAYSLGKLMPDDVLNRIHLCFYDDFAFARNKAYEGLTDSRQLPLLFIEQVLQRDLPMSVKCKFAWLIPESKYSKKEMKIFQGKFFNLPVNLRRIIYKSINKSGSKIWNKKLKEFRKEESEPELQNLIDWLIGSGKKKGK